MLSNPRDIQTSTSMIFADVALDDTYIYAVTKSGADSFRKYNYNLEQVNTSLTIHASVAGITLITAATAVTVSTSSNSVDFIDVNTNARTNITSGANTAYSGGFGPQVCGNREAGVAIATRNSNGNIQKITSAQAVSTLSPTSLSGAQASCIILKTSATGDLQRWLLGTNNGKIIEIDASGTEYQTITLPTTPQISAPTQYTVSGLAHYDDKLLVVTSYGILYIYKYSTSQLLSKEILYDASLVNPTNGCVVGSASGLALIGSGRSTGGGNSLSEYFFNTSNPNFQENYYNLDTGAVIVSNIRINPYRGKAVITFSTGTGAAQMRMFDIDIGMAAEPVDLQNPVGVRVDGRVIRILDNGIGRSTIDSDTSVTAGSYPYSIPCRRNQTYIDLALIDGETKWDIREFTS